MGGGNGVQWGWCNQRTTAGAGVNGNIWSANRLEWGRPQDAGRRMGGTKRSGQQSLITWMSSFCLVALGGSCSQCSASALLRLSPANWPSVLATPLSPFGPLSPLSQNPNNVRLLCVLFCVYAFTVQVSVCPAEFPAILAQQENSGVRGEVFPDIYWERRNSE